MKEFNFKINGKEYNCAVEEIEAGKTNVTVNGKTYDFLEYEGVITKTKYMMLVRLGCSFQNGRIVAPREKSAMVRELLVGKK